MWDESAVWYGLISCGTLWCGMVVCITFGVVQCGMLWCGTVWYLLNREGSGAMQLCAHMTALWYSVVCHVMVCVVSSDVVQCDAGVVWYWYSVWYSVMLVQCSYVHTWLHCNASLNTTHSPTSRCLPSEREEREDNYQFDEHFRLKCIFASIHFLLLRTYFLQINCCCKYRCRPDVFHAREKTIIWRRTVWWKYVLSESHIFVWRLFPWWILFPCPISVWNVFLLQFIFCFWWIVSLKSIFPANQWQTFSSFCSLPLLWIDHQVLTCRQRFLSDMREETNAWRAEKFPPKTMPLHPPSLPLKAIQPSEWVKLLIPSYIML